MFLPRKETTQLSKTKRVLKERRSPQFPLAGAFNPFEKYQSIWIISPSRGETKKCLKPPPISSICSERIDFFLIVTLFFCVVGRSVTSTGLNMFEKPNQCSQHGG